MNIIIKKDWSECEHEKPHPNAILKSFPIWQSRTCSIKEFDKQFGESEGMWKSKGKKHKEKVCNETGCSWYRKGGHTHCWRQMPNKKFWSIKFQNIKQFEKFIKEVGYGKFWIEEQDGCGITIQI